MLRGKLTCAGDFAVLQTQLGAHLDQLRFQESRDIFRIDGDEEATLSSIDVDLL